MERTGNIIMNVDLRVQFGSGSNILEGWHNHDIETDIRQPLPYADNTVDEIMAEHVIEHVSGPDALRFLDECRRILKSGGKLWISIPVLDHLPFEHARDIILGHGHLAAYTHQLVEDMIRLSGFHNW